MKKFLALVFILALAAIFIPKLNPAAHAAIPTSHWYRDWGQGDTWPDWLDSNPTGKEEVEKAIGWELYTGYPDGRQLHPEVLGQFYQASLQLTNPITRAEFASALARAIDVGTDGGSTWYAGRRDALIKDGIIPDASGDWDAPISRLEMGQWMGRAAVKYGADVKNSSVHFSDCSDSNVIAAAKAGVIAGYPDGTFHPQEGAQRVHAAMMMVRLVRGMNQGAPSDAEIREALNNVCKLAYNWQHDRYLTHQWHYDLLNGCASDRTIARWQEETIASGGLDYRDSNVMTIKSQTKIEAHKNACVYKYYLHIKTPEGKEFDYSTPALAHFKRINGKWVLTYDKDVSN